MIYLLLSVVFSTLFLLTFRFFSRPGVNSLQAITVNYFIASALCFASSPTRALEMVKGLEVLFFQAASMGLLFILVIVLIPVVTARMGVVAVAVANKMSFVIPVIAGLLFHGESLTLINTIGLILAMAAVILSSLKKRGSTATPSLTAIIWPVLLFIGSGSIDAWLSFNMRHHMSGDQTTLLPFMAILFFSAGIFGTTALVVSGNVRVTRRNTGMGLILGLINTGSILFLMQAIGQGGLQNNVIFPINNLGVITLSTLASMFLFKEPMNRLQAGGLVFALLAILMITQAA
ncbi:MAG: hypothetical protein KDD36_09835 [Flavobacteriales bacterium]|nr:hypothetical protein [Flavobacteriales bacterium]